MSPYREPAGGEPYRHGRWMQAKRALQRLRRKLFYVPLKHPRCTACGAFVPSFLRRQKDMFDGWIWFTHCPAKCDASRCTCNMFSHAGRCPVHPKLVQS